MVDQKETDLVAAKTQELPALRRAVAPPQNVAPAQEDNEQFRAEQERIKAMIAAKTQELPAVRRAVAPPEKVATAQEDNEQFRAEQERIKAMIAADAPLSEILSNLVLMIESQSPEMLCSILLLSDDGNHVRHAVAPSLPENYVKVIDGSPIGPKHGSCGTAMYRGKPVIVSDIFTDPLWEEYRNFAWAIGVAACWSTPIMSSKGKVLGSFAMYYREPRAPDGEERHLTDTATKLAALAIQHNASREHPASGEAP